VTYGKAGQVSSMLCVCHSPHDDLCFAGADNGEIYVWQGTTLRRTIKGHKGAVHAMYALRNTAKEVRFQSRYIAKLNFPTSLTLSPHVYGWGHIRFCDVFS
jgi:hypothetical protein